METGANERGTMTKKAFTLVELLVVISVMALLMGILMPMLATARRYSKEIFCLNNLRQMLLAVNVYTNDNDGYYPPAYYRKNGTDYRWDFNTEKDWSTQPATVEVWPGLLWQGTTIEKIQQCPSFNGQSNTAADPYTGYNYNTSYLGHDESRIVQPDNTTELPLPDVGSAKKDAPMLPTANVLDVGTPQATAIFGDGEVSGGGANKFMRAPFSNPRDDSFSGRWGGTQGYRHNGKTNVAFCDGHVQSWKKLFTGAYPEDKEIIERYNESSSVKVGFLSEDNSLYDLE